MIALSSVSSTLLCKRVVPLLLRFLFSLLYYVIIGLFVIRVSLDCVDDGNFVSVLRAVNLCTIKIEGL